MATRYYQMSSLLKAETVLRRLAATEGLYPSRPLGYAHLKIVRVDCAAGACPDSLVREIDVAARLVSRPTDWAGISSR